MPLLVESTVQAHPATFPFWMERPSVALWFCPCGSSTIIIVASVGVDLSRPLAKRTPFVGFDVVAIIAKWVKPWPYFVDGATKFGHEMWVFLPILLGHFIEECGYLAYLHPLTLFFNPSRSIVSTSTSRLSLSTVSLNFATSFSPPPLNSTAKILA